MVNSSHFSNRIKSLCLGFSLCIALLLCISLCIGEFLRSLLSVQGMCAEVSAAAIHCVSLQRGEENCAALLLTAYKGVPNEGPDCHGLRNKWDMDTKDVVEQIETFSILLQDQGEYSWELAFQYYWYSVKASSPMAGSF